MLSSARGRRHARHGACGCRSPPCPRDSSEPGNHSVTPCSNGMAIACCPPPAPSRYDHEIRAILERIEGVLTPTTFDPAVAARDFVLASSDLGQMLVLPSLIARISREAPSCRVKVVPPPAHLDAMDQYDLAIMGAPQHAGPGTLEHALRRSVRAAGAKRSSRAGGTSSTRGLHAHAAGARLAARRRLRRCVDAALGKLGLRRPSRSCSTAS